MPIPLPVIADTHRVVFKWTAYAGTAVNVMHIKSNGTAVTPAYIMARLNAIMDDGMWTCQDSSAHITEVDITPLDGTSATVSFAPSNPSLWVGASSGGPLVAVANIIKLTTGVRGRANRGRLFLPFVGEVAYSDGALTGSLAATTTTSWVGFQAGLVATTPTNLELGVASYDRLHSGSGAHFTGVTDISCETLCGTQRRRQSRLRA